MCSQLCQQPELLTGQQSRKIAGLSTAVWMELMECGKLPRPVKVIDRYMWRRSDIIAWVAGLKSEGYFE